jgi:hypothetical protein
MLYAHLNQSTLLFTRFTSTGKNDINVAKVIFIMFQPIWLHCRASLLPNNCSLFSRVVHKRKREREKPYLKVRTRGREKYSRSLSRKHIHYSTFHHQVESSKRMGNYKCEHHILSLRISQNVD